MQIKSSNFMSTVTEPILSDHDVASSNKPILHPENVNKNSAETQNSEYAGKTLYCELTNPNNEKPKINLRCHNKIINFDVTLCVEHLRTEITWYHSNIQRGLVF